MEAQNDYKIPAELKSAVPGYISRREQEVISLKIFASASDFSSISKIGHKLKGNGSSFGFDRISEIGTHLMNACEKSNHKAVLDLISEFDSEIQNIRRNFL